MDIPYNDDTDQRLHLHCFHPVFFLYEITPIKVKGLLSVTTWSVTKAIKLHIFLSPSLATLLFFIQAIIHQIEIIKEMKVRNIPGCS